MFAKTSVARHFVRYASRSEKISVQLLQDYQPLGGAGEIVRVKPAFMRNFLHVGNKACYLNDGPKIPVVAKKRTVDAKKPVKTTVDKTQDQQAEAKPEAAPALSLDELSTLFTNMRTNKSKRSTTIGFQVESTESAAYSLAELGESLPEMFSLTGQKYPISTEMLAKTVFSSTGIEVPASVIKVVGEDGTSVDEITEAGVYAWSFLAPGDANILKRKLKVQ